MLRSIQTVEVQIKWFQRGTISNWARGYPCNILAKDVAAFCPFPKHFPLESNGLISLVEEISRQPNTDYGLESPLWATMQGLSCHIPGFVSFLNWGGRCHSFSVSLLTLSPEPYGQAVYFFWWLDQNSMVISDHSYFNIHWKRASGAKGNTRHSLKRKEASKACAERDEKFKERPDSKWNKQDKTPPRQSCNLWKG